MQHDAFIDCWNRSSAVSEVAAEFGISDRYASVLANTLRKKGHSLKMMTGIRVASLRDRFFRHVEKTDSCWFWTGSKSRKGYGQIQSGRRGGRPLLAHRVSWELHFGNIPNQMFVLHQCDTANCVNPSHLFLGTAKDNALDMSQKKRANGQENQPKHVWWVTEKTKKQRGH